MKSRRLHPGDSWSSFLGRVVVVMIVLTFSVHSNILPGVRTCPTKYPAKRKDADMG